jgi:hypothetical protein
MELEQRWACLVAPCLQFMQGRQLLGVFVAHIPFLGHLVSQVLQAAQWQCYRQLVILSKSSGGLLVLSAFFCWHKLPLSAPASHCRCCCCRSGGLSPGLRLPGLSDLQAFAATMGPLSVTYVCKNLCYILLQVRLQQHRMLKCDWPP